MPWMTKCLMTEGPRHEIRLAFQRYGEFNHNAACLFESMKGKYVPTQWPLIVANKHFSPSVVQPTFKSSIQALRCTAWFFQSACLNHFAHLGLPRSLPSACCELSLSFLHQRLIFILRASLLSLFLPSAHLFSVRACHK